MSHHEPDALDPRLAEAFAALREESAAPARPEALAAARRAMHLAAADRGPRGRLALAAARISRVLTVHRLAAGVAGAAVAVIAVSALGWNAPAGAPLHVVQVAHEQISLVLPGIDRASLDLSYAEARLEQAATGQSDGAALAEAQSLLDDARDHLPADHSAPGWQRWEDDSKRLATVRAEEQGDDHGGAGGGGTGTTPAPGGGERGETSTTSTSTTASGGDGGGGGSSSTETQSRSSSSTTSSGGGDGGNDGSGGGSTSTTSTSTSESSGGDH